MKESEVERLKHFFDQGDPDEIFILEEEIASGSFGAVYKGRHAKTGKYYAVKIITPEEDEVLEDFMVEISVLRKCKHENIVGFFGSWIKGEELFIAMELCDGGAVSDIFQVCNEGLSEDQIAMITRETLKGLLYLHQIGIIHRDIKGANILLSNSGDIKLVDFGVSAELKSPGDRRNTLIGTPYWMAPEVISNKTGNVPYDTKADMWSLGITLLELAERNPPLHEIHPMKALMMIPMREPPSFTHPDQWSKDFREFVGLCLTKQPEKRKSADELLRHPFVTQCKSKSCLVELINKRRRAESKVNDDDNDVSSGDDNSSDEEEEDLPKEPKEPTNNNTTGPPLTGDQKSQQNLMGSMDGSPANSPWQARKPTVSNGSSISGITTGTSPQLINVRNGSFINPGSLGGSNNSTPSDSSPIANGGAQIMNASNNEIDSNPNTPRKESDSSNSNTTVPASGNNRPQSTVIRQGGTKRGTERSNRPTYRTGRNLTRREIKDHQKQIIVRQLLKQQLKEIRNQQQNHLKEQEKQKKQHQREEENLTSKYSNMIQTKQRQNAKDLDALQRRHKSELETVVKTQVTNQKNLQKQQVNVLKTSMKQTDNESKKQEKDFKEELKKKIKEHKLVLKDKQKSLSKKDVKQLKLDQEFVIGWDDLIFNQKQARVKQTVEFDKKQQLQEEHSRYEREQLEKRLQIQWEQLEQQQKFVLDCSVQVQSLEKEQYSQLLPLEITHLQDKQALEKQQLVEQQTIETNQQRQLLVSELKGQLRDFKAIQTTEQNELMLQVKQLAKDKSISKKDLKQKELDLKNVLRTKQNNASREFEEKQGKQRQEEEEMIKNHQAAKREQRKQEQEEEMRKLKELHDNMTKKQADEHQLAEKQLLVNQTTEKSDLLEEQHKAMRELQDSYLKQLEDLLHEYRTEQEKLLGDQHTEQLQFRDRHQRQDDSENAKLKLDHDEEKNFLLQRQAKEKEMFQKQTELDKQQLDHDLSKQKKKLLEAGRRESIHILGSPTTSVSSSNSNYHSD